MFPSMTVELVIANQLHACAERIREVSALIPDAAEIIAKDPGLSESLSRDLLAALAAHASWQVVAAALAAAGAPPKDELVQRYRAALDRQRETQAKASP